jgi:hypothetical protein
MTQPNDLATAHQNAEQAASSATVRKEQAEARLLDHHTEIAAVESEIGKLDVEATQVLDDKKRLEVVRTKRRKLKARLEDLAAERVLMEKQCANLQATEKEISIERQIEFRQRVQAEAVQVAEKIRKLILEDLATRFQRWQELQGQDRRAKDLIRSLDQARMSAVPDFSWSTSLDASLAVTLQETIRECKRAENQARSIFVKPTA